MGFAAAVCRIPLPVPRSFLSGRHNNTRFGLIEELSISPGGIPSIIDLASSFIQADEIKKPVSCDVNWAFSIAAMRGPSLI
jgi:hypothetical protein